MPDDFKFGIGDRVVSVFTIGFGDIGTIIRQHVRDDKIIPRETDCDDRPGSPRLGPDPWTDWQIALKMICRLDHEVTRRVPTTWRAVTL